MILGERDSANVVGHDLASGLGIPAVVLAVAAAFRYVGAAADTEAKPEALREVSRILAIHHGPFRPLFRSSAGSIQPTFGDRQLSWSVYDDQ